MSTKNRDLGFQNTSPSPVEPPSRQDIHPDRRCGIVIGIDQYEAPDDDIHNLEYCVSDAKAMRDLMMDKNIGRFTDDSVLFLENPTGKAIMEAIGSLRVKNREKNFEEVWFYFAGHGYADPDDTSHEAFLVPRDAEVMNFNDCKDFNSATLVSTKSLHQALRKAFPDQTIVMFLDCCCSGSMGDATLRTTAPQVQEAEQAAFRRALIEEPSTSGKKKGGYYCFQAADRFQAARECVFTTHLVAALRGEPLPDSTERNCDSNGYVTVSRVSNYLSNTVHGQDPCETMSGRTNHPLSWDPVWLEDNCKQKQELKSVKKWIAKLEDSSDFDKFKPEDWRKVANHPDSASPAFVKALIHFGTAQQNFTELGESDRIAAEILSALFTANEAACTANEAAKAMEDLRKRNDQLQLELQARPNAPDGRRAGTNGGAEPLSPEERRLVRTVVDGVCPHWSSHEGLQGLWTDLSNAGTESEALEAIRKIGDCVRDEFLGENEHRGEKAKQGEIRFRLLSAVIKQQSLDQAVRDCQRFSQSKPNNALLAELRGLLRMFGAFCLPSRSSDFN